MLFLLAYLMFTIKYFVYGHEYAYFVMNIFGKRSIEIERIIANCDGNVS